MDGINGYLNDRKLDIVLVSNHESLTRIEKLLISDVIYEPSDIEQGIEHIYLSIYYRVNANITLAFKHSDIAINLHHPYAFRNKAKIFDLIRRFSSAIEMYEKSTWDKCKDTIDIATIHILNDRKHMAIKVMNGVMYKPGMPLVHPSLVSKSLPIMNAILTKSPEMFDNFCKHVEGKELLVGLTLGSRKGIRKCIKLVEESCFRDAIKDGILDNPDPYIFKEAFIRANILFSKDIITQSHIDRFVKDSTPSDLLRLSNIMKNRAIMPLAEKYLKMAQDRGYHKAFLTKSLWSDKADDFFLACTKGNYKAFLIITRQLKKIKLLDFYVKCHNHDMLRNWVSRESTVELFNEMAVSPQLSPNFNRILVDFELKPDDKILPLLKTFQNMLKNNLSLLDVHIKYSEKGQGYTEAKESFLNAPHSIKVGEK